VTERALVATQRSSPAAVVGAIRPRQWSKNLLLLAGLVFADEIGNAHGWSLALAAFAAYCLASSAAYLANDVRDADLDRAHPTKRHRPIASGALSPRVALGVAGAFAAAAFAIAAYLGWPSVALLTGFLVLQVLYSVRLKHVPLVDVLVISGLFVIRAAAGAEAVDVEISPWLLVCTGLLALFLALAKRRAELVLVAGDATPGRPVLEGYSLELVDQLLSIVAASTISAYAIYTFNADHTSALMATIPFVVLGIFRYLMLVHRHDVGEEPEEVFLTDRAILATVAGWAVVAAVVLSRT
jgi:4-hydroxybenzoate polyprenyltransferase